MSVIRGFVWLVAVVVTGCSGYVNTTGPEHCGAISGEEYWGKISNPHIITCNTTVSGFVEIGPGVKVQFEEGAELVVTGGIVVSGTAESPVRFEGKDGAAYAGLVIRGNQRENSFSHLTVDGAGYAEGVELGGITLDSGPVKMKNVTIENAFDCGLRLLNNGRVHSASENIVTVSYTHLTLPTICSV